MANDLHGWSPIHGLERLRSAIQRAGQVLRRVFGLGDDRPASLSKVWRFSRHKRGQGSS